ncbi:MAG: hypothetical protein JJU00_09685 [Opitutales bacterium]|nr:hypothetical protein [Opitutales bacterium]
MNTVLFCPCRASTCRGRQTPPHIFGGASHPIAAAGRFDLFEVAPDGIVAAEPLEAEKLLEQRVFPQPVDVREARSRQ